MGEFMQVCLYESLMSEFKSIEEDVNSLKIQNKKLKDKLNQSEHLESSVQVLRSNLKKSEDENCQLKARQQEYDGLEKENMSLQSQIQAANVVNNEKSCQIVKLEGRIHDMENQIEWLKKECIAMGKKPIEDSLTSLSLGKLNSAARLGVLLHINNEESIWFQFKKEKQWIQCPLCGSRSHTRSQCSSCDSSNSRLVKSVPQIFVQRNSGFVSQHKGEKNVEITKKRLQSSDHSNYLFARTKDSCPKDFHRQHKSGTACFEHNTGENVKSYDHELDQKSLSSCDVFLQRHRNVFVDQSKLRKEAQSIRPEFKFLASPVGIKAMGNKIQELKRSRGVVSIRSKRQRSCKEVVSSGHGRSKPIPTFKSSLLNNDRKRLKQITDHFVSTNPNILLSLYGSK